MTTAIVNAFRCRRDRRVQCDVDLRERQRSGCAGGVVDQRHVDQFGRQQPGTREHHELPLRRARHDRRSLHGKRLTGEVDVVQPIPVQIPARGHIPDDGVSVNRRRGRVEIFSEYARQGYTLRELIIAAQDTGHWAAAGIPERLADQVEQRFRAGVLDVITLGGLSNARQHDFAVNGPLHELRNRKIVKPDYTGPTLRENLGLPFLRDR